MLEWLRAADAGLFHKLNADWTHPWLDAVLPFVTDLHKVKPFLYGAAPVMLLWWLFAKRKEAVKAIAAVSLAVALADSVNHRLIKPSFARSRPTKAGVAAVLRSPQHHGYSFPSNHAANTAAAARVLLPLSPPVGLAAAALALLVGYSRVYVGVHFPADVLAGWLVGGAAGWLILLVYRRLKLARK